MELCSIPTFDVNEINGSAAVWWSQSSKVRLLHPFLCGEGNVNVGRYLFMDSVLSLSPSSKTILRLLKQRPN